MQYGILVIDIGMTNKKVAVYDENLIQMDAVYKEFKPLSVCDSDTGAAIPVHDLAGMDSWFVQQIRIFAQKYPLRAVSVTTHGATFVCVDKSGRVCAPCIFYTYEPGQQFHDDFYALCGNKNDLQKKTCTPPLSALINLAKGIRFLQLKFPAEFEKTDMILGFPQYWAYRLTGRKAHEPTFTGCHTYLWDYTADDWSSVTDRLGIRSRMPELSVSACSSLGKLTSESAERLGLDPSVIVTAGIHDSNASLLPYLGQNSSGDFILNSTGTWCVCMHPVYGKPEFSEKDLGKIVFFNRSALDEPVKTAIFTGGLEVDTYVRLYQKTCNTKDFPSSVTASVQALINERNVFILPEAVRGSGQFPDSEPGIYENGKFYPLADMQSGSAVPRILSDRDYFFAALDLSMVIQTEAALFRAGLKNGTDIFTEGGFRRNMLYNTLLASVLKGNRCFLTTMKEATATGCAMSALMALTGKTHTEVSGLIGIDRTPVLPVDIYGYEDYKAEWLKHAHAC